ncbi:MAG: VCBS repeat-containing protein, partial [Deltaproteobacteria bacterium]|nr:VCBS repeat-containing protein [Deltaproteobacteria bacterium]
MIFETVFNRLIRPWKLFGALPGIAVLAAQPTQSVETAIRFTEVTDQTGITFQHRDGSGGEFYIMETVSAGLALFDYDNDGDIDIYLLNGAALKGTSYDPTPINRLYRNDGGWKFTDVTEASGTGDPGFGLGVAVGDYDRDGHLDIYLNNYGPNLLYRNNGDGTFSDVAESANVGDGNYVGGGTAFLDIDRDGDLDLYSARYVEFSYDKNVIDIIGGSRSYMPPTAYVYPSDALYRNDGDGSFTDVSESSGIAKHVGTGMGMTCADYDNDGDTDIFVANDVLGNFLFKNDGTGQFEEVGMLAGVAYDFFGRAHGSMGVESGDYDNDGLLDFFVTSYAKEPAVLYRNLVGGLFRDVTAAPGTGVVTFINPT